MSPKQTYEQELAARNRYEWVQEQRRLARRPFAFLGIAFFVIMANVVWLAYCLINFGCNEDKYPIVVAPLGIEFLIFLVWASRVSVRSILKSFTVINKVVNPEFYASRNRQLLPNSNPLVASSLTPPPVPPFIPTPNPGVHLVMYAESIPKAWISLQSRGKTTKALQDCLYYAGLADQEAHACRYFGLTPQEFEQIRTHNYYRGW